MLIGALLCVLLAALGVSAAGGAVAGQRQRQIEATQTTTAEIAVQFSLGTANLQAGQYQLAAERFRWVLARAPGYPGAAEGLAQAEQQMAAGPTAIPTLLPSTTQDPEAIFAEASGYYSRQEWPSAISRLQELQLLDPRFREVEVKEMLYQSYVTLGLSYVRGDRIQEGLLLLDQAEQIRPLDDQAAGERYLATLYSTGQTYWGLNWNVVIPNFEAIVEIAPNYRDASARLWEAHVRFADQLIGAGAHCDAVPQLEAALLLRDDSVIRDKRDAAVEACANPTSIPAATPPAGAGPTFPPPTPTPSFTIP